ncbi:hypothetical protein AMS68_005744 [Peltaster fructicola]|uniref:Zn(2)-C6 fungal-type domain-containing protein n=1 Tax=Peltaster fructicola TaxID=286661 RepID=A0A6H0XZP7_9PEZI|nr:hypothetical protein AMS68_005744 [Peltaster fructicola]
MALDDGKRKRAKHSKTRKGCSRCKQRHIKCDETKPSCTRCTQANLSCPGYNEVTTKAKRGPVRRFRIIQGPQTINIAPAKRSDSVPLTDDLDYTRTTSTPLKEQTAVDFFTSQTLPTLVMYSPESELWTTEAFTQLTADAKIRNAVIAIGLAHQDLRRNYRRGNRPHTILSDRIGREVSLPADALDCDRYYNAALAYMRVDVSWVKENVSAERLNVAVACLLFVLYLSFQDRMEEASVHMHCGLDIICEGGQSFVCAGVMHREVYLYFLRLATSSWPRHPSASLYALIQASSKLSCHLTDLTPLQSLEADFDFWSHRLFEYTSIVTRGYTGDPKVLNALKNDILEEAEVLIEKMDDYADYMGIEEEEQTATETLDLLFMRVLRARLLTSRLFARSVATRYQTTYDRYTADFDEAITLLGQACGTGSRLVGPDWPLFSINLNLIGIAGQCILLCRHPVIRRKAMAVLKICPQREGLVEAIEVRQVAQMTIDFEESGVNMDPSAKFPTIIPEENRLHFVESIKRTQYRNEHVEEDEMLVRMMYRPDGDSGYVERRVKVKRETYKSAQRLLESQSSEHMDGVV